MNTTIIYDDQPMREESGCSIESCFSAPRRTEQNRKLHTVVRAQTEVLLASYRRNKTVIATCLGLFFFLKLGEKQLLWWSRGFLFQVVTCQKWRKSFAKMAKTGSIEIMMMQIYIVYTYCIDARIYIYIHVIWWYSWDVGMQIGVDTSTYNDYVIQRCMACRTPSCGDMQLYMIYEVCYRCILTLCNYLGWSSDPFKGCCWPPSK